MAGYIWQYIRALDLNGEIILLEKVFIFLCKSNFLVMLFLVFYVLPNLVGHRLTN